jgi:hypothetical protein
VSAEPYFIPYPYNDCKSDYPPIPYLCILYVCIYPNTNSFFGGRGVVLWFRTTKGLT